MHYFDYNEQKNHGTSEFPIEFYHVEEQYSTYNMPFHWHIELEIIYILEGCFKLYLDEKEQFAAAGDIIFINSGVIHGGIPQNCIYECIVFDLTALFIHTTSCNQYLQKISNQTILIYNYFKKEDTYFHQVVRHLFKTMQKNTAGKELIIMGALYELFGLIFEEQYYEIISSKLNCNRKKILHLKPVLEYIETFYSTFITLEQLSHIAGMTPKYFCKYFHAIIHRTPIDYLNYYRIERACYELSTTDYSITEIAYHCGFNDSSYFIKSFKKYKGITPKQYQNQENFCT